jgi:hypothetical protein
MPIDEIINDGTNMVVGAAQGAVADQLPETIIVTPDNNLERPTDVRLPKDVNWYNSSIDIFNADNKTKLPKVTTEEEIADDDYTAVSKHIDTKIIQDYNKTNEELKLGLPIVTSVTEIKPEDAQKVDKAKVVKHITTANKELKLAQEIFGKTNSKLMKFVPFKSVDDIRTRGEEYGKIIEEATVAKNKSDQNKLLSGVNDYIAKVGVDIPLFKDYETAKKAITPVDGKIPLEQQINILLGDKAPTDEEIIRQNVLNPMSNDMPEAQYNARVKGIKERAIKDEENARKRRDDIYRLSRLAPKTKGHSGESFLDVTDAQYLETSDVYNTIEDADKRVAEIMVQRPNLKGVGVKTLPDGTYEVQVPEQESDAKWHQQASEITANSAIKKQDKANALMPEYNALKSEIKLLTSQGMPIPEQTMQKFNDVTEDIQNYLDAAQVLSNTAEKNYLKFNKLEAERGGFWSGLALEGVKTSMGLSKALANTMLSIAPYLSKDIAQEDVTETINKVNDLVKKAEDFYGEKLGVTRQYMEKASGLEGATQSVLGIVPYMLAGEAALPLMIITGFSGEKEALADNKDLTADEKNLVSLVKGTVGALVMHYGLKAGKSGNIINDVTAKTINLLPKAFTLKTLKDIIGKELTQAVSNTVSSGVGFAGLNMAAVGANKLTDEIVNAVKGKEVFADTHDIIGEAFTEAKNGLLTGMVLGGVTSIIKGSANKLQNESEFRMVDEIINNPAQLKITILKLRQQVIDKTITPDQYKKAYDELMAFSNIASQIPKDFSNSSRYQSFKLLKENAEYEKQKAGLAPVYIKRIDGLIEANNAELIKIADNESVKSIPNDTQNPETTNSESTTTDGTNEVATQETKAMDDGVKVENDVVETTTAVTNDALKDVEAKKFTLGENKIFFHASNTKRSGRLKNSNAPQFGTGVYFSTNKDLVTNEFGEHLTEAELTINKPVYTNTKEWYNVEKEAIRLADVEYGKKKNLKLWEDETYFRYDPENSSEIAEIPSHHISDAAKQLGYDAIVDKNSEQYENEIIVLDESKIVYPEDKALATNTVEGEQKSIAQKANELADKIRSLKSPKGSLQTDITGGLKDYALEEIAQLIEDGTVVIEAIKKVLANSKYASLNKDEIRNLVFSVNPLTEKDFERYDSEKVVDRNKRLEADLKQRGYTQNEIDYILRGGVDRIEKVDTVREETKVVDNLNKILKSVQAKAKDMPLKEAVDKAIEQVQGEWVKGKEIILENAIRKFKKEHEIAVTNPTDRAVKPKPIMITVDEKKALTDQIKLEVKAATEGAKSITDGFKEVAKIVNEILKQHKTTISTRQLNAIQKRMAYLKVGSNESVRKYVDYIEKVLANAEYADQLASVKATNKKLKKALKNDKIPASVRATANDFIKLDPADVENLNKHEVYANELLEAMKSGGIKVQDGNIVDKTRKAAYLSKIDAYIAKEKTLNDKRKEESEAEEVTSVATTDNTDEIKRYVQSKFDRLKVLVSQMLQTGLNLDGTPHDFSLKEKSDIAKMLKMDLNVFSNIKDWYEVVETLDHLLTNGDLGLTRNILNRYKAAIDVMKGVDILIRKTEDPIKFLPVTKFFADLESFLTALFKSDVKDSYAQKLYFINSSLRRADNLVKNFKDNDIYENTFYHLAKAYANMKTKVRQMDAMKIHAKLFASNNFDSYRTLESKFKITAYLLQLQHEANPDNNKAKPAIEYLHATSESANSLEHPIQGKALVLLNQVIEQYSQNGQISLESLRKSFTPGEKAAIAAIQKTYKDLYPYHDEVAVAIRNKPSVPYNEYVHIQAILKRKGGGSASEMKKQEYINSLSTKAGTSEDRSGTAHPINMDPFSTANTAIRDVMLDYWMTNPMKNVEKILTTFKDYAVNDLKKYVRGTKEYKDALRKRNVAEAWRDIYEDLRNDVLARSYYESNWIKDIIQLAAKRVVQFTLAKPDRLMAEYLSNLSYVMIALPKEFLLGTTKYSKYLQPALSQQIMENLRSSATERLHPHGGLATSAMDTMDFDISVADNQNAVGEFQRRAMQIYYNTVARPIKGGQNLNEMMVNKGDLAIAIPVWKGVIATEFKRLTGEEIDFDKVASNDVEYFDKYESELYKSTAFADRKVTDVAASKNIFENAPKLSKKSIQLHHALNHYMSGFRMNEYELMADAIVHAAKDGKVSREEAARQIAGITARAGLYKAVQAKAATAMMAAIMGGWAMLQNDEEKTEVDKLIGNMGDDTPENRRKVAAKLLELFATSNPNIPELAGMGKVGDALKTTDEETVKFWKRATEEPNTFIEDVVKGIGQQYLSLLTQRNFGNIVQGFLTAPLFEEYVNKKLRDDYDPYKDSYLYSKLPDTDKKNWLIRSTEANLGAYGLPLAMLMDITVAGIELRTNIKKLDAVNEELKKHIDKVPLEKNKLEDWYDLKDRQKSLEKKIEDSYKSIAKEVAIAAGMGTGAIPALKNIDKAMDKIMQDAYKLPKDWKKIQEKIEAIKNGVSPEDIMNAENKQKAVSEIYDVIEPGEKMPDKYDDAIKKVLEK